MKLPIKLNGWRRIGVVSLILWLLVLISGTLVSYSRDSSNAFIYKMPLNGTQVLNDKVTLPNGEIVIVDILKEAKPWDVDWGKIKNVPTKYGFNFKNIFIFFLFIPIISWLLIETIIKTILWIKVGFKKNI